MNELKEERTDYSPVPFYENNDILLNIKSVEEADEYIMTVLNLCTKTEKEAIIRAYFNINAKFVQSMRVEGKGKGKGKVKVKVGR